MLQSTPMAPALWVASQSMMTRPLLTIRSGESSRYSRFAILPLSVESHASVKSLPSSCSHQGRLCHTASVSKVSCIFRKPAFKLQSSGEEAKQEMLGWCAGFGQCGLCIQLQLHSPGDHCELQPNLCAVCKFFAYPCSLNFLSAIHCRACQ